MRPMPITPSVLLYNSTPSKFFLSQCLSRTFASACGILRATQSNNENACSAVEIVFPPGASDNAQLATGIQNVSRHFGLAAHYQCAERRNQFDKFAFV